MFLTIIWEHLKRSAELKKMCSICGYFSKKMMPTSLVTDMLLKMEHRGPDGTGLYADGKIIKKDNLGNLKNGMSAQICIGHSILRIMGNKSSTQPFQSCDGKLSLVHNGEIYNQNELSHLLNKNHEIADSNNDSEMLLHIIEDLYDGDLLKAVQTVVTMLNGMYVFAVTDGNEVIIARDPIGIKPLYYTICNGVTYFSSEKKAIRDLGNPKRLLPGRILRINKNGTTIHSGVKIEHPPIEITDFNTAVDLYKCSLTDAIRKEIRGLSENKIGVIFSGGIDSVLVAKILSDFGKDITCYCVGMKESEDIENAKKVASDLNLHLKTTIIDQKIVESILPNIIESIEINGLLQVEVAVPMYLAAKAASNDGVRVMFTGQGADELFAGYRWYRDVVREDGYLKLHEKLWEDIDLLYDDTLEREDKVTMAHSIELRVPYLDRNVVETAMKISPVLKIKDENDGIRKWVHRKVADIMGVPDYNAYRVKDTAQSGSGIHDLIEDIATKYFDNETVKHVELIDKGSSYRYLDENYGTPEMWAYMHEMSKGLKV